MAEEKIEDPTQNFNSGIVPPNPLGGSVFRGPTMNVPLSINLGNTPLAERPIPGGKKPLQEDTPQGGTVELMKAFKNRIQQAPAYAHDPLKYGKVFSYGADYTQQNFQRYYQHPEFKNLGFSPFRDNETIYNTNSSGWDDFSRATGQWWNLAKTGFTSSLSSWWDLMNGKPTRPDVASAQEFERAMSIGSSSRGGVSGFMTNMFLNSGYTFGVMGELLLEELAMTGLTTLTAGGSSPVTGPAMGARATMAFSKLSNLNKAVKGTWQAFKNIQNVNSAKHFWDAAKATGNFLNPLERTTNYMRGLAKAENLTQFARQNSAFGAFYRDIRDINFALAEGKLEGGMVQIDMNRQLTDDFFRKNGRMPNVQEAEAISESANKAAYSTTLANLPVIFYTNRVTFDGLFKGFKPLNEFVDSAGGKILFDKKAAAAGAAPFSYVQRSFKNAAKSLIRPTTYARTGLNYFKANLSEGLQESLQEVISGAAKDYYTSVYKDPGKQGMDGVLGALYSNMTKQFTDEGLETFASGFLMGGIVQPVNKVPKWLTTGYYKYFKPEQYNEYKRERQEYRDRVVTNLNDAYADPLKFFAPELMNLGAQTAQGSAGQTAQVRADQKDFQDLKDASVFSHIITALRTNNYDHFIDRLNSIREMDENSIQEAYGQDGKEVLGKIDGIVKRAESIRSRYELVNNKFGNPFNPKKYKTGTAEYTNEAIAHQAFETAKQNAVFMGHSFDRSLERMNDILSDIQKDKPLQNANASDFSVLLDPRKLSTEISMLREEIKAFDGSPTPEGRKLARQKQKRLDTLSDYAEKLDRYTESLVAGEISKSMEGSEEAQMAPETLDIIRKKVGEEQVESLTQLHKSYKGYLKQLADVSDDYVFDESVDNSFTKVRDFYALRQDAKNLSEAVNMLHDPQSFVQHFERMNNVLRQLYDNKAELIEEGQRAMDERRETNALLNRLYDKGIVMEPDALKQYLETGQVPASFYDMTNRTAILEGMPEYDEAVAILQDHEAAVSEEPIPEEKEEQLVENADLEDREEDEVPQPKDEVDTYPTELIQLLKDHPKMGYNQEIARRRRDGDPPIRFEDWVRYSTNAKRIVDEYNRKKQAEQKQQAKPEEVVQTTPVEPEVAQEAPTTAAIDDLVPTEDLETKNRQTVEDLKAAIGKEERVTPILVEATADGKYNIIDGHHRYLAYKELGYTEVPIEVLSDDEMGQFNRLKAMLDKAGSERELRDLEDEIVVMITAGELKLPANLMDSMIRERRKTLQQGVGITGINVGDVLLLKDPNFRKVVVISRNADEIKVRKAGKDGGAVRVITAAQVPAQVELKYEKGMKEVATLGEPTPEEKDIAEKNIQTLDKTETDAERTKRLLDENKGRSQQEVDDEFDNSLGCK